MHQETSPLSKFNRNYMADMEATNKIIPLGQILFALPIVGFGIEHFIYANFVMELAPVPSWIPGRLFLAYLTGSILIAAGISIVANKKTRSAAISLGAMLFLWVLLLHVPKLVVAPHSGSAWTAAFETLALGGAAWVLAGTLATERKGRQKWDSAVNKMTQLGRFCFGISLPVFGILHFIYYDYVASAVPAWIPWHLFWAYFTGVAHLAAGVSILSKVMARLAATLLGIMFGSWVLILHLPRVAANLSNRQERISLFVAMAMCGGAWLIAGSLIKEDSAKRVDPHV